MRLGRQSVLEMARERDLEGIRRMLLQVINQHTEKPVKEIYFDAFFTS
jgi:hypothetical protein